MIEIKNKKASFDYFIEEEIECGIVLKGIIYHKAHLDLPRLQ